MFWDVLAAEISSIRSDKYFSRRDVEGAPKSGTSKPEKRNNKPKVKIE